jgi:hypothetical protein
MEINKNLNKKIRNSNFPESISENLIKYFIINKKHQMCYNSSIGDLYV